MNLQSNQGAINMPITQPENGKKRPGKRVTKLYYKEDIAGLWVFAEIGGITTLITPYPITDILLKQKLRMAIDLCK